jgi:hypothetical protein
MPQASRTGPGPTVGGRLTDMQPAIKSKVMPGTFAPAQGLVAPRMRPSVFSPVRPMEPGAQGRFGDYARQNMGGRGLAQGRGGILSNLAGVQAFPNQGGVPVPRADIPTMGFGSTQERRRKIEDLLRLGRKEEGPTQFGFASGQPFSGLGLQRR